MTDLTKVDQIDLYSELRRRGFAVILWTPEDIESATAHHTEPLKGEAAAEWLETNRKHIEDRSVELGWDVIDALL